MNPKKRLLWLLMFLSPAMGELLSGSNPPLAFFNPVALLVLVLFYGGGTVLIREARVRWNLQWPVMLLAVAYAIWEEGTTMHSFFNPNHQGLGPLSGYGMFGGIQWPWAIAMIFYHATMSTLIPLAVVDLLWPECRTLPLLRKRGLLLVLVGIVAARMALVGYMLSLEETREHPYRPDPVMVIGSLVVIGLLVFLARALRHSEADFRRLPLLPPFAFAIAGFLSQGANLLVPMAMAGAKLPAVTILFVQVTVMAIALAFVFEQILRQDRTVAHLVSLVTGSMSFYIVLSPVLEFGLGAASKPGMTSVGVVSAVLLFFWRRCSPMSWPILNVAMTSSHWRET